MRCLSRLMLLKIIHLLHLLHLPLLLLPHQLLLRLPRRQLVEKDRHMLHQVSHLGSVGCDVGRKSMYIQPRIMGVAEAARLATLRGIGNLQQVVYE